MLGAKSSQLSFYGNHIYDRVIPEGHFLKLLNKTADFSFVNELCQDAYTLDFGTHRAKPIIQWKTLNFSSAIADDYASLRQTETRKVARLV